MTDQHMLIIIILCGIVTILVRVIPFMMISRVNLPDVLFDGYPLFLLHFYSTCLGRFDSTT